MTRSEILQVAKPILFNTEMVRAILDGRKTTTRRVIKVNFKKGEAGYKIVRNTHTGEFCYLEVYDEWESEVRKIGQPYKPGCYLYVRETWGIGNLFYDDEDIPNLCVCYKASEDMVDETSTIFRITDEEYEKYENRMTANMQDWFPSIHMPKEAARIFLRVTDVRVERLQKIDGNGILVEGIDNGKSNPAMGKRWENMQRMKFNSIWDSTIPQKDRDKYGWAANPWVWVIAFERVEATE